MNFAENFKMYRKKLKMTQTEIGALCGGLAAPSVWKWEQGISEPNLETICLIADIFGITVDELIGHEPKKPPIVIKPDDKKEPPEGGNEVTFDSKVSPKDFEQLFQLCVEKVLREKGMLP